MSSWKITLVLEGPVLTKSTAPGSYGLDAVMARDAENRPCFHGSLLKGRLRQAWEELGLPTDPLGPDPVTGRDTGEHRCAPQRGVLYFTDLVCPTASHGDGIRNRVRIEQATGTATDQALLVAESPFSSGAECTFIGEIHAVGGDTATLTQNLEFGLRWITHLGSSRGCGFGKIKDLTLELVPATVPGSQALCFWEGQTGLAITPLDPFCFARHRTAENIFESTDIIPGAAIKGCLAEHWRQTGTDVPPWFDRLRITHAFPAKATEGRRPVALPVSLVMDDQDNWSDSSLVKGPFLFINGSIPRYAGGWKESQAVTEVRCGSFGWAEPDRTLRVRTAIDRFSQRAADKQLFAQEVVEPRGHVWLCRVDARDLSCEEQNEAAGELGGVLARGLRGLGKTKARADVTPVPIIDIIPGCRIDGNLLVLTLQTPAVLLDPRELSQPEARTSEALHAAYKRVYKELLGEDAQLSHFFATQSLAGGQYLWRRFQKDRPYNPWLLTDAGSVFVFNTSNAEALTRKWHGSSLKLPEWTREPTTYGLTGDPAKDWQLCPFIPENGYGEVAANLSCHWNHGTSTDQIEIISSPSHAPAI